MKILDSRSMTDEEKKKMLPEDAAVNDIVNKTVELMNYAIEHGFKIETAAVLIAQVATDCARAQCGEEISLAIANIINARAGMQNIFEIKNVRVQ